jgi:Hint domain
MGAILGGAAVGTVVSTRPAQAHFNHSCFIRGTRIRTPDGERKIEDLKIGDRVMVRSGEAKPVQWIARRRYRRTDGARWPESIAPIRIAQGALGPNAPASDLFISEYHALYLDGVLIPVVELLNGATIARYPAADWHEIEYFHLKLADHDVVYAEGAECESLREGSFEHFDNFIEYERLYGRPAAEPGETYAPVVWFDGGRSKLMSRLRSALSPWIDRRTRFDRVRDDIEDRAAVVPPRKA